LLKVTHHGFTAYYNLNRQYNNSCIKRGARKVIYGTPLIYAWLPVNYIIYLPIDGVKSMVKGWPQGTIYRTKNSLLKYSVRLHVYLMITIAIIIQTTNLNENTPDILYSITQI